MRITEVNLPENKQEGLQKINMRRLGKVVLLAGPNGAGKTRILAAIKSTASQKPQSGQAENIRTQITTFQDAIASHSTTSEQAKQSTSQISAWENKIQDYNKTLDNNTFVQTSGDNSVPEIVDFVPKNINLVDCNSFNKIQLKNHADSLTSIIGVSSSGQATLAKIQMVQDAQWNTSHQEYQGDQNEIAEHAANYQRLQSMINAFLGVKLGRSNEGYATLFEMPMGEAKLSDGQSVLLQLCCAIYSQGSKLDNVIIFMDEPENHLHPKALIDTVKKIESILPNGQLWIATHSIHLLAHFNNSAHSTRLFS